MSMIHILNRIVDLLMATMEVKKILRLDIERGFGSFKERFADSYVRLKISNDFIGEMNLMQNDLSRKTWVCRDSGGIQELLDWVSDKSTLNAVFTVDNLNQNVSEVFISDVNGKMFQLMFQLQDP